MLEALMHGLEDLGRLGHPPGDLSVRCLVISDWLEEHGDRYAAGPAWCWRRMASLELEPIFGRGRPSGYTQEWPCWVWLRPAKGIIGPGYLPRDVFGRLKGVNGQTKRRLFKSVQDAMRAAAWAIWATPGQRDES